MVRILMWRRNHTCTEAKHAHQPQGREHTHTQEDGSAASLEVQGEHESKTHAGNKCTSTDRSYAGQKNRAWPQVSLHTYGSALLGCLVRTGTQGIVRSFASHPAASSRLLKAPGLSPKNRLAFLRRYSSRRRPVCMLKDETNGCI